MSKPYKHIIVGGTFDALHDGHKEYIHTAFKLAHKVTVRINHEDLVQKNKAYKVKNWKARKSNIENHIQKLGLDNYEIAVTSSLQEIMDLLVNESYDSVLTLQKRAKMAEDANILRQKPLKIIIKPRKVGPDGIEISSTLINTGRVKNK